MKYVRIDDMLAVERERIVLINTHQLKCEMTSATWIEGNSNDETTIHFSVFCFKQNARIRGFGSCRRVVNGESHIFLPAGCIEKGAAKEICCVSEASPDDHSAIRRCD